MRVGPRSWLILILVVGAALRFYPIWFGLPYAHARPDEETALGLAVSITNGDLNPHFFHWPSLTFYLFAGVFATWSTLREWLGTTTEIDPTYYTLIGRAIVAVAGTVTIFVLFALARRVAGKSAALLSSAFLAVAMLHVRESHFAMTDVLMTLFVMLSLAMLIRVACDPHSAAAPARQSVPRAASDAPSGATWRCALAGLFGGLAMSTKYNAGAVAAAMVALQILWFAGSPRRMLSLRAWMPSLAFAGAMVAGFLIATPYAVLDSGKFIEDLRFDVDHLSAGHGLDLGRGWIYHATNSLPYGVGPGIFAAAVLGAVPFALRYPRAAWVLGLFAVGSYAVIGSGYTVFFRYILTLVPILCLIAAVGVIFCSDFLTQHTRLTRPKAVGLLLAMTAGPALVQCAWFDLLLARTDSRVLAAEWLEQRVAGHESLHDAGGNYTRLDLSRANVHLWYFDETEGNFGDSTGRIPDWLVLYDSPLTGYTRIAARVRQLAAERYDLVHQIRATRAGGRRATYDRQDAFFMPMDGFYTIIRPGPNIRIYRRRE